MKTIHNTSILNAMLVAVAVFGLAANAHGRLAETREQCDARYGKNGTDSDSVPGFVEYGKAPFFIRVHFHSSGKADLISFLKPGQAAITPTEIEELLKANSNGRVFVAIGKNSWATKDKQIIAELTAGASGPCLIIATKAYLDEEDKKQKGQLKGF